MVKEEYVMTSESVTEGHPDKIADQISDAILDAILKQDSEARVACETMVGKSFVVVTGEITTTAQINIPHIVRRKIKEIGYTDPSYGFDYESIGIFINLNEQSFDIGRGVNKQETGAGDQGMMIGYACDETSELIPLPLSLAQKLALWLTQVRKVGVLDYLRPDGKTQVSVKYVNGKPDHVTCIVIAAQHDPDVSLSKIKNDIQKLVIYPVCEDYITDETRFVINNTDRFVIGGPVADVGMTGRKIIADTYGGVCGHGGGAFSGKDPTKVDKSGAYMARFIAKNLVAANLCRRCEIQLAYVIGGVEPLSVRINTFGTEKIAVEKIHEIVKNNFKLNPKGIIDQLDLLRPIYEKTSCYGHFGREDELFTWEDTMISKVFYNYN